MSENGCYEIHFRNQIQKYFYDYEIKYQFRDGFWAASRVQNHIPWVRALTYISEEDLGCNIPKYELRYNLIEPLFLQEVGYRLIAIGRIYKRIGIITPDIVAFIDVMIKTHYKDNNRDFKMVQVRNPKEVRWWISSLVNPDVKKYYTDILEKYNDYFIEALYKSLTTLDLYDFPEMKKDIEDMKKTLTLEFQHSKVDWDKITEESGVGKESVCKVYEVEGLGVKFNKFRKTPILMDEIDKINKAPYYTEIPMINRR